MMNIESMCLTGRLTSPWRVRASCPPAARAATPPSGQPRLCSLPCSTAAREIILHKRIYLNLLK